MLHAVELPTKMGQPVDCDRGLGRREDEGGDGMEGEDRERVGEKAEGEEEGGWEDGSEKQEIRRLRRGGGNGEESGPSG